MSLRQYKNLDFESVEKIEEVQLELLQNHLKFLKEHSKWYQKLNETSVHQLHQLSQLPFTCKEDLQEQGALFLSVSKTDILEYVSTSGTTGKPLMVALSKQDLERLTYNEKRALEIAQIAPNDTVQITTTLDKLFVAGMAYYKGLNAIGASAIRMGVTPPEAQIQAIQHFNSTAMIAVPTYVNRLIRYAQSHGVDLNALSVAKIICIGDVIREADFTPNYLHKKIRESWNLELFSTYASTESMTAFTECEMHQGGHVIPELVVVEIVDEAGNVVAPGQVGEVVVTPLQITGMPLLRYKTGDMARLHTEPCACGRNTPRLGPIEGRKSQKIKFKGTTIYPLSIENVIDQIPEIEEYIIEIKTSNLGVDEVSILVNNELSETIQNKLKDQLVSQLRVLPNVVGKPKEYLRNLLFSKEARKPKKIIDLR